MLLELQTNFCTNTFNHKEDQFATVLHTCPLQDTVTWQVVCVHTFCTVCMCGYARIISSVHLYDALKLEALCLLLLGLGFFYTPLGKCLLHDSTIHHVNVFVSLFRTSTWCEVEPRADHGDTGHVAIISKTTTAVPTWPAGVYRVCEIVKTAGRPYSVIEAVCIFT